MMSDKSVYKEKPSIKKQTYLRYVWILPIGVLLIASVMKIVAPETMASQFKSFNLEHPVLFILFLGLLELSLVITFLIPATRIIGFLLITTFIGGIIATEFLSSGGVPGFPILLQIALWTGIYFEKREFLSHLFPERSSIFKRKI